jgi:hypothetical protein
MSDKGMKPGLRLACIIAGSLLAMYAIFGMLFDR